MGWSAPKRGRRQRLRLRPLARHGRGGLRWPFHPLLLLHLAKMETNRWHRAGKLGAKDAARSKAVQRWPDKAELFKRVKDDGRAEACLIAYAGGFL